MDFAFRRRRIQFQAPGAKKPLIGAGAELVSAVSQTFFQSATAAVRQAAIPLAVTAASTGGSVAYTGITTTNIQSNVNIVSAVATNVSQTLQSAVVQTQNFTNFNPVLSTGDVNPLYYNYSDSILAVQQQTEVVAGTVSAQSDQLNSLNDTVQNLNTLLGLDASSVASLQTLFSNEGAAVLYNTNNITALNKQVSQITDQAAANYTLINQLSNTLTTLGATVALLNTTLSNSQNASSSGSSSTSSSSTATQLAALQAQAAGNYTLLNQLAANISALSSTILTTENSLTSLNTTGTSDATAQLTQLQSQAAGNYTLLNQLAANISAIGSIVNGLPSSAQINTFATNIANNTAAINTLQSQQLAVSGFNSTLQAAQNLSGQIQQASANITTLMAVVATGAFNISILNSTNFHITNVAQNITSFTVLANNSVSTVNNMIDDGVGNAHFLGALSANSLWSTSDVNLKHQIEPLDNMTPHIMRLQPVNFKYISDEEQRTHSGLIAQQVQDVFPHIVKMNPQTQHLSVSMQQLISPLIQAFQELHTKHTELQQRVEQLQTKIDSQ